MREPTHDLDCRIKRRIVVRDRRRKLTKLRLFNYEGSIGASALIPTFAHARIMAALKDQQDTAFSAKVEPLGVMF